jgi:predicted lipoprotein with Yx(FWY)xxD motif
MKKLAGLILVLLLSFFVLAQEKPAMLTLSKSDDYGSYLSDGQGRTLYLFVNEEGKDEGAVEMDAQGVNLNAVPCTEGCLQVWPAFVSQGEPQVGEGLDAALLKTVTRDDGTNQLVYNGWPLYYFHQDQKAGDILGQDIHSFGGTWYIVSDKGDKVEKE